MKNIDQELYYNVLDSEINRISIYWENYLLIIDLFLVKKQFYDKILNLKFIDIKEFGFYHNFNYGMEIPALKFFMTEDELFYISMDPFEGSEPLDQTRIISKNDQNFILSKDIKISFVEN